MKRAGWLEQRWGLAASLFLLLAASCAVFQPPPQPYPDEELARLASLAGSAFDRGDMESAERLYRKALKRSRARDDARAVAAHAYNLAVSLYAQGEYAGARELAKAVRAEVPSDVHTVAEAWLLSAKAAYRSGLLEEARVEAAEGVRALAGTRAGRVRAQLKLLQARVALERGRLAEGEALLAEARALLDQSFPPSVRAEAAGVAGLALMQGRQPGEAGQEFDRETSLLRQSGLYREMAQARVRAGEAYREAGLMALAADRYFRAARSFFAQDLEKSARGAVAQAAAAAAEARDEALAARIQRLRERIEAGNGA